MKIIVDMDGVSSEFQGLDNFVDSFLEEVEIEDADHEAKEYSG